MRRLLLCSMAYFMLIQESSAQLCPGGGTTFANAVVFNQAWISGCTTGTSCNGGSEFDNRAACEPTTAMDACGPNPSCTTPANNGSDVWFYFYATGSTATIAVNQNVSFVVSVQAFSGSTCGTLTQIGCVLATGPSNGVVLNLSGLTTGQVYYMRVFGSASSSAQRTGTYCFCGSTNLGSAPLPVQLSSLTIRNTQNRIILNWSTASESNNQKFEIERSNDGVHYTSIGSINGRGNSNSANQYSFTDLGAVKGNNYYRLKIIAFDGTYYYSDIVNSVINKQNNFSLLSNPSRNQMIIESSVKEQVYIISSTGQRMKTSLLQKGRNNIDISDLTEGIYFIKGSASAEVIPAQVTR